MRVNLFVVVCLLLVSVAFSQRKFDSNSQIISNRLGFVHNVCTTKGENPHNYFQNRQLSYDDSRDYEGIIRMMIVQ